MSVFINSKKSYIFPDPNGGEDYSVPAAYLGEVPDWVSKTELFKLAVKEKSITMVGKGKSASVTAGISNEEKALRAEAKKLKVPDYNKLSLVDLAIAVDKIKNPTKGITNPETEKDDSSTPPES